MTTAKPKPKPKRKPRSPVRARFVISVLEDGTIRWQNQGLSRFEVMPVIAEVHAGIGRELNPDGDAA